MEGNDESGATCDYLPAVPVRGTGYHRYVFIHLQHGESLDLSLLPVSYAFCRTGFDSDVTVSVPF